MEDNKKDTAAENLHQSHRDLYLNLSRGKSETAQLKHKDKH